MLAIIQHFIILVLIGITLDSKGLVVYNHTWCILIDVK